MQLDYYKHLRTMHDARPYLIDELTRRNYFCANKWTDRVNKQTNKQTNTITIFVFGYWTNYRVFKLTFLFGMMSLHTLPANAIWLGCNIILQSLKQLWRLVTCVIPSQISDILGEKTSMEGDKNKTDQKVHPWTVFSSKIIWNIANLWCLTNNI